MSSQLDKIAQLRELAVQTGQYTEHVKRVEMSLTLMWSETLFQHTLRRLSAKSSALTQGVPGFVAPSTQDLLPGELSLGTLVGSELSFKLRISDLAKHAAIAGSSGFGKTWLGILLANAYLRSGEFRLSIVDPKADDMKSLAMAHQNVMYLVWSSLRFNIFTPPPNSPEPGWFQMVVELLSQLFNFWDGARSMLLKLLAQTSKTGKTPTIDDLIKGVAATKSRYGPKQAGVLHTTLSRLETLRNTLGVVASTDSRMLLFLQDTPHIVSTSALMSEIDSFLSSFLLMWKYYYRIYNPEKRETSLHIYDEAQHRFMHYSGSQKTGSSVVSKMINEARSLGIGICALFQQPTMIIPAILNSSILKVAFRLGNGSDIRMMREAMGLTKEQSERLFHLQPGEAIVRLAGEYTEPMLVTFDSVKPAPVMGREQFSIHQENMKTRLYELSGLNPDGSAKTSQPTSQPPKAELVTNREPEQSRESSANQTRLDLPVKEQTTKSASESILKVWLNLTDTMLTQSEVFAITKVTSGSKQARIKKHLVASGFIKEHKIQVKKTYVRVWEPTESAYQLAGVTTPRLRGIGGYLHSFIIRRIELCLKAESDKVSLEYRLSNNKSVDVAAFTDHVAQYYEVAISRPFAKEISNIEKDFGSDLVPEKLTVVAVDSKAKRELEELISRSESIESYRDKIEVKLAGEFLG